MNLLKFLQFQYIYRFLHLFGYSFTWLFIIYSIVDMYKYKTKHKVINNVDHRLLFWQSFIDVERSNFVNETLSFFVSLDFSRDEF